MPKYELWELRLGGESLFLKEGSKVSALEGIDGRNYQKTWECKAPSWTEAQELLKQEMANPTRSAVAPPRAMVKPIAVPALKFKKRKKV